MKSIRFWGESGENPKKVAVFHASERRSFRESFSGSRSELSRSMVVLWVFVCLVLLSECALVWFIQLIDVDVVRFGVIGLNVVLHLVQKLSVLISYYFFMYGIIWIKNINFTSKYD